MSKTLTEQDYIKAANILHCEVAAIKAVAEVESRGAGFLPDGRPKILFERHIFHKLTKGKFSAAHPDISNKKRGGYVGNAAEWNRLERAKALDAEAALQSASWGKFQIMGFNFEACGFKNVFDYVEAMRKNEGEHLNAFVNFITDEGLDDELRKHQWRELAEAYNGPAYAENHYDVKMANAYARYKNKPLALSEPVDESTNDIQAVADNSSLPAQSEQLPTQNVDAGAAATQVNVSPAPAVEAAPLPAGVSQPSPSQQPGMDFKQASIGGAKRLWSFISGLSIATITAIGSFLAQIGGFLKDNPVAGIAIGVLCLAALGATVYLIKYYIGTQAGLDKQRMQHFANKDEVNVR